VIIQSEALNKSFRRHEAVRGISLAVPEGNIYALIGANGAGKTTTIKTLLNILTPTSGRAEVLGVDSRRLSPIEFAKIGYVSENQELPPFAGVAQQTGRNDGIARDARFADPRAIAIDAADNLFVADTGNGLIRKITPAGIVSTIMGISGEKGSRSEPLRFKNPRGVVCAPDGSIYVIDSNAIDNGNPLVRKISPAGVVSTVAGPDEPVASPNNDMVLAMPAEEVLEHD